MSSPEAAGKHLSLAQAVAPVSRERIGPHQNNPGTYVSYIFQSSHRFDGRHHQAQYYGPETVASELLSADLASTRWLDLLATDAAQADNGFSLAPTHPPNLAPGAGPNTAYQAPQHVDSDAARAEGQTVVRPQAEVGNQPSPFHQGGRHRVYEQNSWQLSQDICLQNDEVILFRTFAERAALWLDLFDPHKHFSTHATRLAVSNNPTRSLERSGAVQFY